MWVYKPPERLTTVIWLISKGFIILLLKYSSSDYDSLVSPIRACLDDDAKSCSGAEGCLIIEGCLIDVNSIASLIVVIGTCLEAFVRWLKNVY